MEVGLDSSMPTYSGGLGILAGDTLRAAADLGLPMIGVTLLHRQGYFRQHLDVTGNQLESPAVWNFEEVLEPMAPRILVPIEGQQVHLCAWRHLVLALLEQQTNGGGLPAATDWDREAVRQRCVFTTHTPVPAGHDQFSFDLVSRVLGPERLVALEAMQCIQNGTLNLTYLALQLSRYINGVAMRHGEISRDMFPHYPIDSITNGVHALTWTSLPFRNLYDRYIPEWRRDNFYLRYATKLPLAEVRRAHVLAKRELLAKVAQRRGTHLDENVMTLCFARRAATYKRADLLFEDLDRLKSIAQRAGPFQVIYGGKAHPQDDDGKAVIRRIFEFAARLGEDIRIVYMENYDMELARSLCAGVDLWLNTPQRPMEASGTSGMKAALNGVPSLSILDGWWIEGHVEGVTGWAIGDRYDAGIDLAEEANSLYDKLEHVILPLFYSQPQAYTEIRRSTIALNGSFFHTQRMVLQYLRNAYLGVEP